MKRNLTLLIFLPLFQFITGCSLDEPIDPGKFLYNFQGQTFRQIKYRSLDNDNLYRLHSGVREIRFDPAEYKSTFQNYFEFSVVPCYGSVTGVYSMMEKSSFLEEVGTTGADDTDSNNNGIYDIFEPYGANPEPESSNDDKVDLVEYFVVININNNTVSPGCPIQTDSKLFYQFLFYQNGDLILRDYNREIEFFLRPFN